MTNDELRTQIVPTNDKTGIPAILAAAAAELESSGLGAGASRLVCGSRPVHHSLETALAGWLGRERALLFPSGFQANLAAVAALSDRHSLVLADRLIHHSLLAGVRASGARLQRFAHNDPADLRRRLQARLRSTWRPLTVVLMAPPHVPGDAAAIDASLDAFDAWADAHEGVHVNVQLSGSWLLCCATPEAASGPQAREMALQQWSHYFGLSAEQVAAAIRELQGA